MGYRDAGQHLMSILAFLGLFIALALPNRFDWITPSAFVLLPLEYMVIGLLLLLPARVGRVVKGVLARSSHRWERVVGAFGDLAGCKQCGLVAGPGVRLGSIDATRDGHRRQRSGYSRVRSRGGPMAAAASMPDDTGRVRAARHPTEKERLSVEERARHFVTSVLDLVGALL